MSRPRFRAQFRTSASVTACSNSIRQSETTASMQRILRPMRRSTLSRHHSNPTVTVANADNGGNGRNTPGIFVYNQTLSAGSTSSARHFKFNDPQAQLFSFDALVTARARGVSVAANGSQPGDGDGGGRAPISLSSVTDTYTGLLLIGSGGNILINGVDYVDVPFVAKEGAFGVQGTLDASPVSGGAYPDLDFELRDDQGHTLDSSGNLGPQEDVGAGITPGRTYVYRVIGYASGPTQFAINSEQFILNGSTGGQNGGNNAFLPTTTGTTSVRLVRFTVNPLTNTVTARIL